MRAGRLLLAPTLAMLSAQVFADKQPSEPGRDLDRIKNCHVEGFKPFFINGWFKPIRDTTSQKVWMSDIEVYLFYEKEIGCWVINRYYQNSDGLSKMQKLQVTQGSFDAAGCSGGEDGGSLPPKYGWLVSKAKFTQVEGGTVTCSYDAPMPSSPAQIESLQSASSKTFGASQVEMSIVAAIVVLFWLFLCACRWRTMRRRSAELGLLEARRHQRRLRRAMMQEEDARFGLTDVLFEGGGGGIGCAEARKTKHPQQIALEAVYFMQREPYGTLSVACPPDKRQRREVESDESDASRSDHDGSGRDAKIAWRHVAECAASGRGEGATECCVCLENVPDILFQPCGHAAECRVCFSQRLVNWSQNAQPYCSICRTTISDVSVDTTKRYEVPLPPPLPPHSALRGNAAGQGEDDFSLITDIVYASHDATAALESAAGRLPWFPAGNLESRQGARAEAVQQGGAMDVGDSVATAPLTPPEGVYLGVAGAVEESGSAQQGTGYSFQNRSEQNHKPYTLEGMATRNQHPAASDSDSAAAAAARHMIGVPLAAAATLSGERTDDPVVGAATRLSVASAVEAVERRPSAPAKGAVSL